MVIESLPTLAKCESAENGSNFFRYFLPFTRIAVRRPQESAGTGHGLASQDEPQISATASSKDVDGQASVPGRGLSALAGKRPPNEKFDRRSKEIYKKHVDICLTGSCYPRATRF
jgi:hypothetical protein